MKKIKILIVLFVILSGVSCSDNDDVRLSRLKVTISYVDEINNLSKNGVPVKLVSTMDNTIYEQNTNDDGVAYFTSIASGNYNVQCVFELTEEQAESSMGYYEEITLNGVYNDLVIAQGEDKEISIVMDGSPANSLVIKEVYYDGANDPSYSILFKDQFVEIYNNSNKTVYADGLYLAELGPNANGSSENDIETSLEIGEYVYAKNIAQIPGSGEDYPVDPGRSIVIAFNAVDWTDGGSKSDITVNLSQADFELYAIDWLEYNGREGNPYFDVDNVDVQNMNIIYMNQENGASFIYLSTGPGIIIFRDDNYSIEQIKDPESPDSNPTYYSKIKTSTIIDAVDNLFDAESSKYKRLPINIDAGFTYVNSQSYSSKSLRRKVKRVTDDGRNILQDSNNSSEDFEEVTPPTPYNYNK